MAFVTEVFGLLRIQCLLHQLLGPLLELEVALMAFAGGCAGLHTGLGTHLCKPPFLWIFDFPKIWRIFPFKIRFNCQSI